MTYIEETFLLLRRAGDYLGYAETNRRSGIYGPAVSMAYYATFYAAQAMAAYHREGPKAHKGVRKLFHRLAIRESDFPGGLAAIVDELSATRLQADYDHQMTDTWTDADAANAIQRARPFVDEVNAWFERHHTPEPA